jgi:uncharacterized protein YndB with AHSA1/START domain
MSKIIQQTITFQIPPHEVYEALMDSVKHAAFTGAAAEISRARQEDRPVLARRGLG